MQLKKIFTGLIVLFIGTIILAGCDKDSDIDRTPTLKEDVSIINSSETFQTIVGFGGSTVFRLNFPLSDEDMDIIFGNDEGDLGFTIHRIRVVPDNDVNGRSIELNHAKGAIDRGAIVLASPWSPPARMKTNNNLIGGALKRESYEEFALYLNDFAEYMKENGAPLYAISVQNEPDIQVSYESCDYTAGEMRDFVAEYGDRISATKLMAPESFQFNPFYADELLNNPEAESNVDIIGGHIYGGGLEDYPLAREKNKEIWMTEHLVLDTMWNDNLNTGKEIHDCLAIANYNAYLWWYVKRFYGPLRENGTVSRRGNVMSHFSRFVRPGYVRIGAIENPQDNVYVSAYQGEGKIIIVSLNMGEIPVSQQYKFENADVSKITPYISTELKDMEQRGDVEISSINTFSYGMQANSIATFVGE